MVGGDADLSIYDYNDNASNKNLQRVTFYKVNHIYNERIKSGLIEVNTPNRQRKVEELQITKNNSAKNINNYSDLLGNDCQSSFYQFKLNLLRNNKLKHNSQFSIYHFLKSHNIYIFIKNSKYNSKSSTKDLFGLINKPKSHFNSSNKTLCND